ncbi:uncharacterized protein N7506_008240, partial [Penicillium brevicompactum]|uniref:uncharacterized protein n=1 Tax=Penicillium brevicompactum TaxID=5074 RepID=UPI00254160D8
ADRRVLPLLLLGFAVYQLDRTNIASALTGGFARIISVDTNTINLGNQLMFLGVILLEIPSNMMLHKIGPRRWISGQVFVFGLVACLQIFLHNKSGFLATRSILGLTEAGYIPCAMYTLSTWYDADQLTKRIAIFFFGMFGGTAISPLLGAGLLRLDGKGGLFGWQWIFLGKAEILHTHHAIFSSIVVEGLFAIAASVALFFFLPEGPVTAPNLEDQESGSANTPSTDAHRPHISLRIVWETVTNVRKLTHFVATGCVFSTWNPLTTYTPSIIVELGFAAIEANALAAIGSLLTLPIILFFAWMSDKSERRGVVVMISISIYLASLVILRVLQPHVNEWGRLGLWTLVNAFAVGYHPIHNAWIQVNCKSSEERSISVA